MLRKLEFAKLQTNFGIMRPSLQFENCAAKFKRLRNRIAQISSSEIAQHNFESGCV